MINYKNGVTDGSYILLHPKSKTPKVKGHYQNDLPHGIFEYYDENGQKIYETINQRIPYKEALKAFRDKQKDNK